MRRIRVSAAVVALLLGACSSSGTSSVKRSESTTTTTNAPASTTTTSGTVEPAKPRPAYTKGDLTKLLVPLSSVPSGFSLRSPDQRNDDETQVCDLNAFSEQATKVDVSYVGGNVAILSEELISYSSATRAATVMRNARAAFESCNAYDKTDANGAVTHYVVAPLSFALDAGDQAALRLTFTSNKVSGTVDLVAARVDNIIMVTAGLSASSTPGATQLKPGDFASFTNTAYKRIS